MSEETAQRQTGMIEWSDVRRTLVKLCYGKGIGPSCVPDELLKLALDVKESDDRVQQPIADKVRECAEGEDIGRAFKMRLHQVGYKLSLLT